MKEQILLVDDSKSERTSIKNALGELFDEFIEAEDGLSAIKAFVDKKPNFIITDVEMPSMSGYRFLETVRQMEDGQDVPVILISATKDSLKGKLTGFNLGASDFLIKPFNKEELVARVKSLLRIRNLMTELKQKNILLEKLAITDDLTGLNNRRYFFETVREQLALGVRHNFDVACMLLDIDYFKSVNDTHGHLAGDDVLKALGTLLTSAKREGEILARFGGEEFIICLFNTDPDNSVKAADRFRTIIEKHDFSSEQFPKIGRITVSIGVSICSQHLASSGDNPVTIDELLKTADTALYRSKSGGRNRITLLEHTK